jgi:hypothetical protein
MLSSAQAQSEYGALTVEDHLRTRRDGGAATAGLATLGVTMATERLPTCDKVALLNAALRGALDERARLRSEDRSLPGVGGTTIDKLIGCAQMRRPAKLVICNLRSRRSCSVFPPCSRL